MSITVSIVEDERATREQFEELIKITEGLSFREGYPNAESALRGIPLNVPDVILMDLNLPKMSGVECVKRVKEILPGLKVLMLTKFEDANHIFQALKAGANGYLLKRKAPSELTGAIVAVMAGHAPMSSEVATRVVAFFHNSGRVEADLSQLSPRELETLEYLAKGYIYKEIASRLGIKFQTVNGYIKSIYEKLHVHSRTEAVAKYLGM